MCFTVYVSAMNHIHNIIWSVFWENLGKTGSLFGLYIGKYEKMYIVTFHTRISNHLKLESSQFGNWKLGEKLPQKSIFYYSGVNVVRRRSNVSLNQ